MNYRMMSAALLGMSLILPVSRLHAEDQKGSGMESQEHHMDSGKWQKKLGLTDDQATKLKAISEAQKTALKPLWDKQKDLMKKLGDQVKSKAPDADIQATLDDMKANHKSIMDQMEQFRSQKAILLTPTQQAKMLLHRMKHHRHEDHHEEGDEK